MQPTSRNGNMPSNLESVVGIRGAPWYHFRHTVSQPYVYSSAQYDTVHTWGEYLGL